MKLVNDQNSDVQPVIIPIAPPAPEPVILPFRIGIAPPSEAKAESLKNSVFLCNGPFVESNSEAEMVVERAPVQVIESGQKFGKKADGNSFAETPKILDAKGDTVSSLTWPKYLAWRKTKCRPYDYVNGPRLATEVGGEEKLIVRGERSRGLEEIDQAVHEFVGEVAELGELIVEHGPDIFYGQRAKLIDEIGDILFCGAWVLDAWGSNPLDVDDDGLEIVDNSAIPSIAGSASVIQANSLSKLATHGAPFLNGLSAMVMGMFVSASSQAGLLCNSYKKLRYQRREQNVEKQVERVCSVFCIVNQILGLASATIEDAMRSNMAKLDARFPEGYKPGVGGGIRTGDGK